MRNSHILNTTFQPASTQTDYCIEEVDLLVGKVLKKMYQFQHNRISYT